MSTQERIAEAYQDFRAKSQHEQSISPKSTLERDRQQEQILDLLGYASQFMELQDRGVNLTKQNARLQGKV